MLGLTMLFVDFWRMRWDRTGKIDMTLEVEILVDLRELLDGDDDDRTTGPKAVRSSLHEN